jgi:hypothetical protein
MDGLAGMNERYRYTGCGLDYVYLLDGYTVLETEHGRDVPIKDARQLHDRIALDIIGGPHPLRGQEVRFLRGMLKLSQEGWRGCCGSAAGRLRGGKRSRTRNYLALPIVLFGCSMR